MIQERFLKFAGPCAALVVLVVLVASGGCSKRYRIQIESDTCWEGSVDNTQGISGCGNSSYKVIGPMRCVGVHKSTPNGFLHVRIDNGPWSTTTDPYGDIEACE